MLSGIDIKRHTSSSRPSKSRTDQACGCQNKREMHLLNDGGRPRQPQDTTTKRTKCSTSESLTISQDRGRIAGLILSRTMMAPDMTLPRPAAAVILQTQPSCTGPGRKWRRLQAPHRLCPADDRDRRRCRPPQGMRDSKPWRPRSVVSRRRVSPGHPFGVGQTFSCSRLGAGVLCVPGSDDDHSRAPIDGSFIC